MVSYFLVYPVGLPLLCV